MTPSTPRNRLALVALLAVGLASGFVVAAPVASAWCVGTTICVPVDEPPSVCIENGDVQTGECVELP